jgi:hypothetical protein
MLAGFLGGVAAPGKSSLLAGPINSFSFSCRQGWQVVKLFASAVATRNFYVEISINLLTS